MPKPIRLSPLAAALVVVFGLAPAAMAETLRCRSVNGNVTCAGSGAVSCQTVDGRTVCVGGGGALVQRFGGAPAPEPPRIEPEEEAEFAAPPREMRRPRSGLGTGGRLSLERRGGPAGGQLSLEREGSRLRLRTEGLVVDLD
jgi:hypothetical protein